ncbi:glucuronate isomerase, partial [Morganella morganii]|uniref:glucuronate isomerase n=1 Tax=Morganella morganii TaxID=582 RepID=UPI001FFD86BA
MPRRPPGSSLSVTLFPYSTLVSSREIAKNRRFDNHGPFWLEGDHYKWRGMRSAGIPEQLITGRDSSDYEKYQAWAKSVPMTIG